MQTGLIRKGARVTGQSRAWYDGTPVQGWPNALYIGTVTRIVPMAGCVYARVKYDSGRTDFENVDRLAVVEAVAP